MSGALAAARARVERHPNDAEAQNDLGMLLGDQRQFAEAAACFRRALAITKDAFPQALHNLGMALMELGEPSEAEKRFRKLLALLPHVGIFHADHGGALLTLGRYTEAEQSYRRALRLDPSFALAHFGLAKALRRQGRLTEAEPAYRAALQHTPRDAAVHIQLGATLFDLGRIAESEQHFEQAIALDPAEPLAHAAFAYLLIGSGRLPEAEASCRRALSLDPTLAAAHNSLAFVLNFIPGRGAAEIYAAHQDFGRCFRDAGPIASHSNSPNPERRLRIGYVSPDFRDHAVAYFIEPVLESHDRDNHEIFCYYNFARADPVTKRLKSHADRWREVEPLSDEALTRCIRADEIDILVDLSGHTSRNRLAAFALKPAPVQATWLGYLNTTGLGAMDYRITDSWACPEGSSERFHSEKLIRLPDSQWCYRPRRDCPDVGPLPAAGSGIVTFAAFTSTAKTTPPVIDLWQRLLARVPQSRLLVQIGSSQSMPQDYADRFAGIARDRLEFIPSRSTLDYLALRNRVDLALDTFPCTGGTTTCDSLWMGVPVVTLAGDTGYSRGGVSLLHAAGLDELVAETPEQYLDIAAALAANLPRLASLRSALRDRVRSSPLTDAARFTRNLEAAYRTMWRAWCASRPS